MERSEPTLIPEWLKGSGNVTGGGTATHQTTSSSLLSDDHAASKHTRNRSSVSVNGHDIGRSSIPDGATSSNFRRSSGSNGSGHLWAHSSFGRSSRDREWEREMYDTRDKDKSILGDFRQHAYSDPLDNSMLSRVEKDLRRSHSMITGKRGDTWSRKVSTDLSNNVKSNHNNSNGLVAGSSVISTVHKTAFERDFPSLGTDERQAAPEIRRVSSPGLSTAIQSLPMGNSTVIGGDGWTSALAEVPVIVGSNGPGGAVQQAVTPNAAAIPSSTIAGLNMAETVAQGPSRANNISQVPAGNHRLEELVLKQSRQLIPVTPAMPKTSVLNPSEKTKAKISQQHQNSSQLANFSPRSGAGKSDISRTSTVGKLQVLKPARERNGVPPTKDSLSPTGSSKVAGESLYLSPSAVGPAPSRSPGNNPNPVSAERKPALTVVEKRPTLQAQSRNDFFNLVRKKSMSSPSAVAPGTSPAMSPPVLDKSDEAEAAAAKSGGGDTPPLGISVADQSTKKENDVDSNCETYNGLKEPLNDGPQEFLNNGKTPLSPDAILYSEEEEAAFLRSLGWEEKSGAGEDEALTEEEISSFYQQIDEYIKLRPSLKTSQRMHPKFLRPLHSHVSSVEGATCSGSSSSDSKVDS